ncbi:MAG TPA: ABC transporter permease [Dehalococcoidia bacterium]|nr:ABC transporter permease [Dehalococcoidia bacterium]
MRQYFIHRLMLNVPVVFLVVTLVFLMGHARPDFAEQRAAQGLSSTQDYEAAIKAIRHELGTDRPLWEQYGVYLRDTFTGDFGTSFITHHSVTSELGDRLAPSVELGALQIAIALAISIPIGIISAVRQDSWMDYVLRLLAVVGLAIPSFFLGTLLLLFATKLAGWTPPLVPTAYRELWEDPAANLKMMLLPALAGGFAQAAVIMRLLRSELLDVLRQDYVRTAWSKGLAERAVVARHVLRNALGPVVTVLGLMIGILFGGNVVLESMFAIPGAGQFLVISLRQNDFPVVQGVVLIIATALVTTNLIVDLSYGWLDPRIRYGRAA